MANLLAFAPSVSTTTRAQIARDECVRQHRIRFALMDIAWRVANAPIATQDLTKIGTLERLARLTIVSNAKPIKMTMRGYK